MAAGAMPVITTESLEYKAAWYGRELVTVDRFFPSSTLCSGCGAVQEKPALNVREWRPVLERMRAEHVGGTDPWTGFQARVTDPGSGDAERVESELDRLSGGSDARLEHEETFLVTAMNQLPART